MKIAARMRRRKAVPPIAPPMIVLVGVGFRGEVEEDMLLVWELLGRKVVLFRQNLGIRRGIVQGWVEERDRKLV
jgi:hypothetical protein